jgi:folate-binding protein YgfZ
MTGAPNGLAALERGRAFVNLSEWWKVWFEGADAHGWLNDLLSVELEGIRPGEARRSLLLTPTGRIRAAVSITPFEGGYLALQDPSQPSRLDALLDPYVLSSYVRIGDLTDDLRLLAFPGIQEPPMRGRGACSPSVLGPGTDVVIEDGEALAFEGLVEAGPEEIEAWRVRRGIARFGTDLTAESLPHEVELGDVIAYGKGCFLGQEAVARVRNLGRPPFVLLAASAEGHLSVGEQVLADGGEAGSVTSAAPDASGGTAVIARVRWALKDAPLRSASGAELRSRGLASAA